MRKKESSNQLLENELPNHLPQSLPKDLEIPRESLSEKKLRTLISNLGLKVTPQRVDIIVELYKGKKHVTATELYLKLKEKSDNIGLATVLRFLKQMVQGGIATETKVGGSPARYEIHIQGHHDHLTCTKCGKICEFHNKAIEDLQLKVAGYFGFKLEYHILELYGTCFDCNQNKD